MRRLWCEGSGAGRAEIPFTLTCPLTHFLTAPKHTNLSENSNQSGLCASKRHWDWEKVMNKKLNAKKCNERNHNRSQARPHTHREWGCVGQRVNKKLRNKADFETYNNSSTCIVVCNVTKSYKYSRRRLSSPPKNEKQIYQRARKKRVDQNQH